jgi:hypothetical protein
MPGIFPLPLAACPGWQLQVLFLIVSSFFVFTTFLVVLHYRFRSLLDLLSHRLPEFREGL